MTSLPPILWLGNDWHAENRTSSHHVALRMSGYTRVIYFGCPGLRVPLTTPRDLRRAIRKWTSQGSKPANVSESLSVSTLVQLPFHGVAAVAHLNGAIGRSIVRQALRRAGVERPVIWCTVPHVLPLVERLNPALLVYYCVDDYSTLPRVDTATIARLDDRLARKADLVIAVSRPVWERHRRTNPAARLIPHGVDLEHFARPPTPHPRPAEIADISGPIVGFIGSIEPYVDLQLVDSVARQLPDATFVIIGRIAVPVGDLPTASNVRVLGPRPYATLPHYGHHFDAAIIPYKRTAFVNAANPLKLREYLAMGLPVVSVSTPEVELYRHVVSIAHTQQEFADNLRRALSEGFDGSARHARVAAVATATWDVRVTEMVAAVRAALNGQSRS